MKFLSEVINREIKRIKDNKRIITIMLLTPIVLCFIICEIFKVSIPTNLPIAVFDSDNSKVSRQLTRMVNATQHVSVDYRVTNFQEGKNLLTSGKAYALLVIPENFERDIFRLERPKLVLFYNNQFILIGGIVYKDIYSAIATLNVGLNVKFKMKNGIPNDVALVKANILNIDEHSKGNPYTNYSYFLVISALSHIFQVTVAFLAIFALGSEFKKGSVKNWLETANNSIITALIGKLLPYFLVSIVLMLITYTIYFTLYGGVCNGNVLFIIFSIILFVLVYQLMGVFFLSWSGNMRLALSGCAFYTAVGFTFSGITFPQIAMPLFAKLYAYILPIMPYLKIMLNQTLKGTSPIYDISSIIHILILTCIPLTFLPRLKKLALNERYWGKE